MDSVAINTVIWIWLKLWAWEADFNKTVTLMHDEIFGSRTVLIMKTYDGGRIKVAMDLAHDGEILEYVA